MSARQFVCYRALMRCSQPSEPLDPPPVSQVWSLGCTLAEMAAGGVPLFPGASTLDQLARIMRCFGPLPASQTLCLHADKRLVALRKPPPRSRNLAERLKVSEDFCFGVQDTLARPLDVVCSAQAPPPAFLMTSFSSHLM